jgi:hypothetical protein
LRICRGLLPRNPAAASRELSEGPCFRDPVVLGSALAAAGVLVMDRHSLAFVMASMLLFHLGPMALFADQYLPECGTRRDLLRLLLPLGALGLAPVRVLGGDAAAAWGAGALALAAAAPDLVRLGKAAAGMLRGAPAPGR